jgi:transposase InsO family protein
MEQRYRAVLQVQAGVPVIEVAEAFGVSRQAVHRWLRWYRDEGLSGLGDGSHRPREHPWQIDPAVEAAICEMRRDHPRWGKRRLAFELGRQGCPGPIPSQSTIYRALVRHNFIQPTKRGRPRDSYQRWERPEPMQLWQLDIVDGDHLVHGQDTKIITGVDDHSRFCVICAIVARATGRAVCLALVAAFRRYGIPDELLTDNGKQFTARFNPGGGETMFDRICRENGVVHHLTPPRTPTTTGKIERFHQSLQNDWLTDCPGFASVAEAQAALDAFVVEYNTDRPHQSLDMDFPADRFRPRPIDELGLQLPPALGGQRPAPVVPAAPVLPAPRPAPEPKSMSQLVMSANGIDPVNLAVQIDRVLPTCGNLTVCGHQFWLGPGLGGVAIQLWIDTTVVHILRDQTRIKSVPSRFTTKQLRQLLADGATVAGPPPTPTQQATAAFEVDRLVNRCGVIGLAGRAHPVGYHLAGQRVILRIDGPVMQILDQDRTLLRTLANPLKADDRRHVRDGRPAGPPPVVPETPGAIQRRVSCRGVIMVAGQRITVGIGHAGLTVTVSAVGDSFQVYDEDRLLTKVTRTTSKPIARFKARKPELPRPQGHNHTTASVAGLPSTTMTGAAANHPARTARMP